MDRYVLRCDQGHKFEAWFRSKGDADRLVAASLALCPNCDRTPRRVSDNEAAADRQIALDDVPPVRRPFLN